VPVCSSGTIYSNLLVHLWMEALKTATHILNRFHLSPFLRLHLNYGLEGNHHLIKYLCVSGCVAQAKLFNPQQKIDGTTVSSHFIGYCDRSKGYWFYHPYVAKIIETKHVVFL
jgi:hypothetical protein